MQAGCRLAAQPSELSGFAREARIGGVSRGGGGGPLPAVQPQLTRPVEIGVRLFEKRKTTKEDMIMIMTCCLLSLTIHGFTGRLEEEYEISLVLRHAVSLKPYRQRQIFMSFQTAQKKKKKISVIVSAESYSTFHPHGYQSEPFYGAGIGWESISLMRLWSVRVASDEVKARAPR